MLEINRTIGVLFAVLLLLSVTATAVSARPDSGGGWSIPHISPPPIHAYPWEIPFSSSAGSFLFRAQLR